MTALAAPPTPFLGRAGRVLNSGQARTLLLTGNLHDLFWLPRGDRAGLPEGEAELGEYVPLVDFLRHHWDVSGKILVVYELNGPVRFVRPEDRDRVRDAWLKWRTGRDEDQLAIERMLAGRRFDAEQESLAGAFDQNLHKAIGNPSVAFELLRQMCLCSRTRLPDGSACLADDLVVIVEAADLALPESPVPSLSDADRRRLAICHDWFADPGFLAANDAVVLLVESRSLLHHRIAGLPPVLEVEVPSPDAGHRRHFVEWFRRKHPQRTFSMWSTDDDLVDLTAGLSLQALSQLLKGASHGEGRLDRAAVVARVEAFLRTQLGDDVVELEKPEHRLSDVVGATRLKEFLRDELIPRFQTSGPGALPGAAVAGPIGSGKTFIFQAVAAELDAVVLTLKNLRSQWFGQTDVIFERLRRVLGVLGRVVIFVDEADTQFGGVDQGTHATERRLTGRIQQMMSDPKLRGRVFWLLMTARIHALSADIRRPGRVGDLILPVLDPEGDDRRAFLRWVLRKVFTEVSDEAVDRLDAETEGWSAAAFAALRSQLSAQAARGEMTLDDVVDLVHDLLSPAIGDVRRYQTLQALRNCTRRRLLPDPSVSDAERAEWEEEIRRLEARGIR